MLSKGVAPQCTVLYLAGDPVLYCSVLYCTVLYLAGDPGPELARDALRLAADCVPGVRQQVLLHHQVTELLQLAVAQPRVVVQRQVLRK